MYHKSYQPVKIKIIPCNNVHYISYPLFKIELIPCNNVLQKLPSVKIEIIPYVTMNTTLVTLL